MECKISEALFKLILPQVKYPHPDQLVAIQAELDKEWPPGSHLRRHLIQTDATVSAKMENGQVSFFAHFWLNVEEGGDWVIDRVLPDPFSHFQGPFAIYPQLDKPIIAIRNVFCRGWYICLEEEKGAQEELAMKLIREQEERVKRAFQEAIIINLATVPTA